MSNKATKIWQSDQTRQLAEALVLIRDTKTMQNFLTDVMTSKEIIEIAARLEAAKMLTDGKTYATIVAKTNLSSRTVARISDWLKNGFNGYQAALKTLDSHHSTHDHPARLS